MIERTWELSQGGGKRRKNKVFMSVVHEMEDMLQNKRIWSDDQLHILSVKIVCNKCFSQ